MSYQVELNFLVYTRSRHSASADFAVTLKCHTGVPKAMLSSCSTTDEEPKTKNNPQPTLDLLTHAEIDLSTFSK